MRRPAVVRGALLALVAYCLFIGVTAVAVPHTFYTDFPFLAHWVELLPPYNEHLVTDVGGLYCGFAFFLAWAAWKPERGIVLAASLAFLVVTVPHLLFHVTHLDGFGAVDGVAQTVALTSLLVPPLVAIWGARSLAAEDEALWPVLHYEDTDRALAFLTGAFGFEPGAVVRDEAGRVVHAELHRPGGGSLVFGWAERGAGVHADLRVGAAASYVATDAVEALHARARDAGAEIVQAPHETAFGTGAPTRAFTARDPEGNLWTFGTYRGAG